MWALVVPPTNGWVRAPVTATRVSALKRSEVVEPASSSSGASGGLPTSTLAV